MIPAVSAHATAAATTRTALAAALASGAELVELDVQRCRDGVWMAHHDAWVRDLSSAEVAARTGALRLDEAAAVIGGRAGVHLDLKPEADEVSAVRRPRDCAAPAPTWWRRTTWSRAWAAPVPRDDSGSRCWCGPSMTTEGCGGGWRRVGPRSSCPTGRSVRSPCAPAR